jgi:hypothetical protein
MTQDAIVTEIQNEWLEQNRTALRWMIVETPEGYEVHQHSAASVWPPTTYPTKRLAAARLLQLLGIGPVAPQTHPESVCVGYVRSE